MSNRRTFLAAAATAAVAPRLTAAANSRIVVGVMGAGSQGTLLAKTFAGQPNVEVAAIAEVDPARGAKAAKAVADTSKSQPKVVGDFRRLLDDKAIDVFVCAAPNHWHAPAGILACQAGKHAYVEKPCSHNPREGELLVAAAAAADRRVQVGTHRRSFPKIIEAMQALREGIIGRAYFAQSWYTNNRPSIGVGKDDGMPAGLDYDLWQGPAPRTPFRSNYLHYNWHWFWAWGNGELGNNGIHYIDLCRWGLGVDYPTRVTSAGGRYRYTDDQQTPDTHVVSFDFADGKTITWEGFSCNQIPKDRPADVLFQGENGTLVIAGGGYTVYDPKGKEVKKVEGKGGYADHVANLLAAVRSEAKLTCDIAAANASTTLCHLGNIAHRTGRSIVCEPKTGRAANDPDAMRLWSRAYAAGWEPK